MYKVITQSMEGLFSILIGMGLSCFTYPRPIGDGKSLRANTAYHNATLGAVISEGLFVPQGLWCATSPSCSSCLDCSLCSNCLQCIYPSFPYQYPQCTLTCEQTNAPQKTPFAYSLIVAASTTYLLIQLKQLLLLWLPRIKDKLFKRHMLYEYDLHYIRNAEHENIFDIYHSNNQPIFICKDHDHKMEMIPLPSHLTMLICSYLGKNDLIQCFLVTSEWQHTMNCNILWKNIYLNDFGKYGIHNVSRQYKDYFIPSGAYCSLYAKKFQYIISKQNVEKYEQKYIHREEFQTVQLNQWKPLEILRDFASLASIVTLIWQYLDVIYELFQWFTVLSSCILFLYMLYLPISTYSFGMSGKSIVHFMLGLLVSIVILNLIFLVYNNNHLHHSHNTKSSSNSMSMDFELVLSLLYWIGLRILPYGLLILHLFNFYSSEDSFFDFIQKYLKQSLILLFIILLSECIHYQYNLPIPIYITYIFPMIIFSIRGFTWFYSLSHCLILSYDELDSLEYSFRSIKSFFFLFLTESIFTFMGYSNMLLRFFYQSGFILFTFFIRLFEIYDILSKIFCYSMWSIVKLKRCREYLKEIEWLKMKQRFFYFFCFEMSLQVFQFHTPLILQYLFEILSSLQDYLHWSRSVTFLALLYAYKASQLPQHYQFFKPYQDNIVQYFLKYLACLIVSYDIFYDCIDTPAPYQPYLDMIWLSIWYLH